MKTLTLIATFAVLAFATLACNDSPPVAQEDPTINPQLVASPTIQNSTPASSTPDNITSIPVPPTTNATTESVATETDPSNPRSTTERTTVTSTYNSTATPTVVVAPVPTPVVTSSPTPVQLPTATPDPVPDSTSTPTVAPAPSAAVSATPEPTAAPTPTITPTGTPAGPTPSPVPTATATSTPDPFYTSKRAGSAASKYGVIVHDDDPDVLDWTLQKVQADWYLRFNASVTYIPSGKSKLLFIEVGPGHTPLTNSQIQAIVDVSPGAVWYLGGEPNRLFSVDDVVEDLQYYYTEIKLVDPTARITSPSILNWDFTCIGCGGYTAGKIWMAELVTRYQDLYGELPPWDIWAIDLYPLNWWNLPNTGFLPETINQYAPNLPPNSESIPAKQLQAYRTYIDSLPGKSGQPIMVTELGIHWGWTEIQFGVPGCPSGSPAGEYKALVIKDYFDSVFTWLENNHVSHNIERWFTYVTYSDINNCRYDGYSGMSLLNSPEVGAQLSEIGRWYALRSSP